MLSHTDAMTIEEHLKFATDLYLKAVELGRNAQPSNKDFVYAVGIFEGYLLCLFKNETEKERYVTMIHERVAAEYASNAVPHRHP